MAWGNLLRKQGKKEEAIEKYQKALQFEPSFHRIHGNIAWTYFQNRDYENALIYFEKRIKSDPKCLNCWSGISISHNRLERYEEATEAYDQMITLAPDLLWGYVNKASFLMSRGDTLGATALFQLAEQRAKDGPEKYMAIGGHYMMTAQPDSALVYAKKILEIQPDQSFVLNNMVRIYFDKKDYEKALSFLPRIRGINENAGGDQPYHKLYALNLLAMSSYKLEKYEDALTIINESIEVDPSIALPYTTLAETYGLMGRMEEFYDALETALEKGFPLEMILEDEPYVRFLQQPRFQKIIKTYQEKKKKEELAQAVKG